MSDSQRWVAGCASQATSAGRGHERGNETKRARAQVPTRGRPASRPPRAHREATSFLKEWHRLEPPPRFQRPHLLHERAASDLREVLQSTREALGQGDPRLIAEEQVISIARYRADIDNVLRAYDELRRSLSDGVRRQGGRLT